MENKYKVKSTIIKKIFINEKYFLNKIINVNGWVRTCRTSEKGFGFCVINDGSNVKGLQLIISKNNLDEEKVESFFKNIKTGSCIV